MSFTCQPIFVIIATLSINHSFTYSLQDQNLPFQQILPTFTLLRYPLDCLHDHGTEPDLDRTYHAHQFIFIFFLLHFLFIPCGRLSWLSVSFLVHVKYTVSYRIVSYRIVGRWSDRWNMAKRLERSSWFLELRLSSFIADCVRKGLVPHANSDTFLVT